MSWLQPSRLVSVTPAQLGRSVISAAVRVGGWHAASRLRAVIVGGSLRKRPRAGAQGVARAQHVYWARAIGESSHHIGARESER